MCLSEKCSANIIGEQWEGVSLLGCHPRDPQTYVEMMKCFCLPLSLPPAGVSLQGSVHSLISQHHHWTIFSSVCPGPRLTRRQSKPKNHQKLLVLLMFLLLLLNVKHVSTYFSTVFKKFFYHINFASASDDLTATAQNINHYIHVLFILFYFIICTVLYLNKNMFTI